jgi:hypothetical protein
MDLRLNGHDLSGIAFSTLKGNFTFTVLAGRQPAADDEILLGTKTMAVLHAHIGSTLSGIAENEQARPVTMRVVGRGVLPPGNAAGRLGQGAVVTRAGLLRLAGGTARSPYVIAARFRPGTHRRAALASLDHGLTSVDHQFVLRDTAVPTDLVNFGRIQRLPLIVGAVLALLASLTLVHLLVSSIRRRRRDLAILKTLGFVRSQISRAVAWQSTTVVVVAIVLALPLGTAAGRLAWRLVADQLGIAGDVVTPRLALLLVVPATLVLANVVALIPAAVASRTGPASALRAE